jgi:hypothetical protein
MIHAAFQYNSKQTKYGLMTYNKELDIPFHTRYLVSYLDEKKETYTKCDNEHVCLFK